MSLYHAAKVLEICGFLLATAFGGILLNPEMVGRLARRIEAKLADISATLVKQYESIAKPMSFIAKFEGMVGAIVIRGIAVGCITAGWLNDISWLFWLGLAFATPYALLGALVTFLRLRSRASLNWIWLYPIFLCWALVFAFLIAPIAFLVYWLFLLSHGVVTLFIATLVLKDATKKVFVILGSTLVIIGLILESIATW